MQGLLSVATADGGRSCAEAPRTERRPQTRGEGPAAEQLGGAAAHVPEEPACPRNLCVRDPCVMRGPCARGARVPTEPVCPRSACARGVCGIQTSEFAPDLKSGSCRAGTVRAGPFTSQEGPVLFQSTDGGCLKTHMRMFLGLYLRKKSKEEVWWTSGDSGPVALEESIQEAPTACASLSRSQQA